MIEKLTFDQIEQIVELIKTYNNFAVFETDIVMSVISLEIKPIYGIKQPSEMKIILFVHDVVQVLDLTPNEKKVIFKYWPGALTIIKNDISYHVPNHKNLLKLIIITVF